MFPREIFRSMTILSAALCGLPILGPEASAAPVEVGWEASLELVPHPEGLVIGRIHGPSDGPARALGLARGQLIHSVNGEWMADVAQFHRAIRRAERVWGRAELLVIEPAFPAGTGRPVTISAEYGVPITVAKAAAELDLKVREFAFVGWGAPEGSEARILKDFAVDLLNESIVPLAVASNTGTDLFTVRLHADRALLQSRDLLRRAHHQGLLGIDPGVIAQVVDRAEEIYRLCSFIHYEVRDTPPGP